MSQLCSTHHDFVATLYYIPGVCAQLSESGHNAGKQLVVLETRYGILWPWYGQFVVRLSQPPQLWSGAEISWVVLVLVSMSQCNESLATANIDSRVKIHQEDGLQTLSFVLNDCPPGPSVVGRYSAPLSWSQWPIMLCEGPADPPASLVVFLTSPGPTSF